MAEWLGAKENEKELTSTSQLVKTTTAGGKRGGNFKSRSPRSKHNKKSPRHIEANLLPYRSAHNARGTLEEVKRYLRLHDAPGNDAEELQNENDVLREHVKELLEATDSLVSLQKAQHEVSERKRLGTMGGLTNASELSPLSPHSHSNRQSLLGLNTNRRTATLPKTYVGLPPVRDPYEEVNACAKRLANYKSEAAHLKALVSRWVAPDILATLRQNGREIERQISMLELSNRRLSGATKRAGKKLDELASMEAAKPEDATKGIPREAIDFAELEVELFQVRKKNAALRHALKTHNEQLSALSEQQKQATERLQKVKALVEDTGAATGGGMTATAAAAAVGLHTEDGRPLPPAQLRRHVAALENALKSLKDRQDGALARHSRDLRDLEDQRDRLQAKIAKEKTKSDAAAQKSVEFFSSEEFPAELRARMAQHYLPKCDAAAPYRKHRLGSILQENASRSPKHRCDAAGAVAAAAAAAAAAANLGEKKEEENSQGEEIEMTVAEFFKSPAAEKPEGEAEGGNEKAAREQFEAPKAPGEEQEQKQEGEKEEETEHRADPPTSPALEEETPQLCEWGERMSKNSVRSLGPERERERGRCVPSPPCSPMPPPSVTAESAVSCHHTSPTETAQSSFYIPEESNAAVHPTESRSLIPTVRARSRLGASTPTDTPLGTSAGPAVSPPRQEASSPSAGNTSEIRKEDAGDVEGELRGSSTLILPGGRNKKTVPTVTSAGSSSRGRQMSYQGTHPSRIPPRTPAKELGPLHRESKSKKPGRTTQHNRFRSQATGQR
uniref:Uncharacterized protein n=1 Tax=Chromera velia CCMP2878 TaxID=1169474 RepID=A0A0G4GY30_9ALVE|eukprot:Cvel_23862.t1-p1 / transcript=Cvel_23862.t1 / gene=Cvel_23862 / organism=Chromera_velia_CCMP2878 / gene_product=hypothetical protein / transcript_product=hypothetical protein / location=Cvel_scaffold2511:5014-10799(-) / protein_length=786 / sequence_SO=supercontig / SO=protein_coding / is_pseudo=false